MADDKDDASTVSRESLFPATQQDAAYEVVVLAGGDVGKSITIDASRHGPALVGKGPACDLRLDGPMASRRHASLEVVGEKLRVVDLGSTNGTTINGLSVVEALLRGGEHIAVGETTLEVRRVADAARAKLPLATKFGGLMGASREMRRLYPLCDRLAQADVPVIVEGETGTGKEALAEALHLVGPRRERPFVVFDCASTPATLLESELFGYERGAFTGAVTARPGVFEAAEGGTLLIDEIGDLDLALQPKLLRAIDRREVRRLGANQSKAVDVRIIAATRRDLDKEVQAGRFRDDLLHRLAVARIELPPLRRRGGDVRFLARVFCHQMGGDPAVFTESQLASWEVHPWPGNVRELRNAVARTLALGDLAQLARSLPESETPQPGPAGGETDAIAGILTMNLPLAESRKLLLAEFERRYLQRVLERHGGNVRKSAAAAGVAKRHFQRLKSRS